MLLDSKHDDNKQRVKSWPIVIRYGSRKSSSITVEHTDTHKEERAREVPRAPTKIGDVLHDRTGSQERQSSVISHT